MAPAFISQDGYTRGDSRASFATFLAILLSFQATQTTDAYL